VREKWHCVEAQKWSHGMVEIKTIVSCGCLPSSSMCRRGFQDLLKVGPSSLFMLCGCISTIMSSLMSWSKCSNLAERSFVSCSLIIWSWLMLFSTTADLLVCVSLICLLCWFWIGWIDFLSIINLATFTWDAD